MLKIFSYMISCTHNHRLPFYNCQLKWLCMLSTSASVWQRIYSDIQLTDCGMRSFMFQRVEELWEVNLQLQFIQKFADKSSDCLGIVHYNERARKVTLVLMKIFHICKINILTVLIIFLIILQFHCIWSI
jgi:hypothetical protein